MRYVSTRGQGGTLSFNDVLLAGLAPDGGLYVPEEYPPLTWRDIRRMKNWSYNRIALHILSMFVGSDIEVADLRRIIDKAYNPRLFGSTDITPIQPMEPRLGLLKLSNGPTLAFKDVALQLLAGLMDHVLEERDERLNILGATSGDTGSAAEEAVRGRKRLRIFMLSPFGRMTPFQAAQMYRIHDDAVFNLVPEGNFDDCQAAVKLVNSDADFKKRYAIGAVNSINWARIVAQVVYYVYAYSRVMDDPHEVMHVAVPSGNFGNALAAYVAAMMGLRMHIIVATNENDVLHEFFKTGVYRVRVGKEVKKTHSPSMDIASASNFERFMFDLVGRDSARLLDLWKNLALTGEFTFLHSGHRSIDGVSISSGMATDAEVIECIRTVYEAYRIIIDPHTAVAFKVGEEQWGDYEAGPAVVAETAQPAKFEDAIRQAIGLEMGIPPSCSHLRNGDDRITRIHEDDPAEIAEVVKRFIEEHAI